MDEKSETQLRGIVGIGASAGGLDALQRFFENLYDVDGFAYVVVQHLSSDFRSLMDELLVRYTPMPVYRVEDGVRVQPNTVYVIPSGKDMVFADGNLKLTDKDPSTGLSLPIDLFFSSLAKELGPKAAGVVLSGTGSDGSRGVRELSAAGGFVLVQDPDSAAFDGMPRNAIETGIADAVGWAQDLPTILANWADDHATARILSVAEAAEGTPIYDRLFSLLEERHQINFQQYKPQTLIRRIERRVKFQELGNITNYMDLLENDSQELQELYFDLLIGVTSFFRDPGTFEFLERHVVPDLVRKMSQRNEIRIWVPACATGEEAYSYAILIHQEATRQSKPVSLKVFATDIHQASLTMGGNGTYGSDKLGGLSEEQIEKYFTESDGEFTVIPELRQYVVFANHNILANPPFTKLDLVSCRNLLIYFKPQAQKRVIGLMNFALRRGGFMVLGRSESFELKESDFEVMDRKAKIFVKTSDHGRFQQISRGSVTTQRSRSIASGQLGNLARPVSQATILNAYDALIGNYVPPGVLVNSTGQICHVFGDLSQYLTSLAGRPSHDLASHLPQELKIPVSSALQRARKEGKRIIFRELSYHRAKDEQRVTLIIEPLQSASQNETFFLVSFESLSTSAREEPVEGDVISPSVSAATDTSPLRIEDLEQQLEFTKETLQSTILELETSREELQSTNEELMASNEELQSTNEELQSVNEELYTVNAEYQSKIDELSEITADLDNLLRSSDIGAIFVDAELHVRNFTQPATSVFNLMPQDMGRPLEHISSLIEIDVLKEMIGRVIDDQSEESCEVSSKANLWYFVKILPYRNSRKEVEGAVITVTDITEVRRARQEAQESWSFLQVILDNLSSHIAVLDDDGRIVMVNKSWCTFADENGEFEEPQFWVGRKYFDACFSGDRKSTTTIHQAGLDELMALFHGDSDIARFEYPCHSPTEERWFEMTGIAFRYNGKRWLLMAHDNITHLREHSGAIDGTSRVVDQGNGNGMTATEMASAKKNNPTRVLVVDDDKGVGDGLVRLLSRLGAESKWVQSGQEAMHEVEDNPEVYDLVFLDINMPGMNGYSTYNEMRRMANETVIYIMSGMSIHSAPEEIINHPKTEFIQKPFAMTELRKALEVATKG